MEISSEDERKRVIMAKNAKMSKPISARTKGLICLVLLCALTVFVSCLGIGGMKLDNEGVNVLLPWVPVKSSDWPQSLPLNRALGGGIYSEYTATVAEGENLDETVQSSIKVIKERLQGLGEEDVDVFLKGSDTIRMELRSMDSSRFSSVRSLAVMPARFEYRNSDGTVLLTEKDITGAGLTVNDSQTAYLVNVTVSDEGVKKLEEANVTYVSVYADNESVASYASVSGNKISMSFGTSNFNTASNVAYLINTGAVDATLTLKESGDVAASAGNVKTVVLIVAAALLVLSLVYLLVTAKLTGFAGFWTVWCAVLLGLFFVATIVVPSVYALNVGCLVAMLLGILLAVYTAVTRSDAISAQIKDGSSPKQASKLGFRASAKQIWIVHGGAIVLSLILMIFSFSKSTGYTLAAFVVGSAITVVLMRAFQACFTAISSKPALFGKAK